MIRIATIIVFFFLSSCTGVEYNDTLQKNHSKIAFIYSSKDKSSFELIDYALCYDIINKPDTKFTMIDMNQEPFSLTNKFSNLSTSGYKFIISMLSGDNAKELNKAISNFDFTLFSVNSESYNYKNFMKLDKFEINQADLSKVDNYYKHSKFKPVPQNSITIYKILSFIFPSKDTA